MLVVVVVVRTARSINAIAVCRLTVKVAPPGPAQVCPGFGAVSIGRKNAHARARRFQFTVTPF